MLCLGRKYKFTERELEYLNSKFKNVDAVRYDKRNQDEVLKDLENSLRAGEFNMIVLNTKASVGNDIIKYLIDLQFKKHKKKLRIITIEHFMEEFLFKCYIPEDHKNLSFLDNIKPFSFVQYIQKRIVDFLAVFSLLILALPIMILSRYKIKKESKGSSLFKQVRVGFKNRKFKCIKFRSMHKDSYHDKYTRKNDTRIFAWGNTMRKTRIDELPQLLNVLKGDMHFIGPRAEWDILVDEYEKIIPYYNERHLVRPGITGWAQVMYPYGGNAEDARQKLMYDLYYIKYWSLALEIKVAWKTVMVVLGRKGL